MLALPSAEDDISGQPQHSRGDRPDDEFAFHINRIDTGGGRICVPGGQYFGTL